MELRAKNEQRKQSTGSRNSHNVVGMFQTYFRKLQILAIFFNLINLYIYMYVEMDINRNIIKRSVSLII